MPSTKDIGDGEVAAPPRQQDLPPKLTPLNVGKDIITGIQALLISPQALRIICPLVICLASLVCKVVIYQIPYTEIDYTTYMQQVDLVEKQGERNYAEIYGDSGPLVYPAGFIAVYSWIEWLVGDSIRSAQQIFGYLYTASVALSCVVYGQVWDMVPWPILLLVGSKRLVSVYVLRLFNDCWTTVAMVAVVVLLQQAAVYKETRKVGNRGGEVVVSSRWLDLSFLLSLVAADLYSLAISIKMNALLYLPGFVIVVYFLNDENLVKFLIVVAVIPVIQVVVGWKFLVPLYHDETAREIRWNYLTRAFDFNRKFLYEWTVNWRFVPEDIFSSDVFARVLLAGHVVVLLMFTFTRFLNKRITGKSVSQVVLDAFKPYATMSPHNIFNNRQTAPQIIFYIMAITNLIGVLFARSLHYQFLSWYAWLLPALLYLNFPIYIGVPLWFAHEWCWNAFPSTQLSSALLVALLWAVVASSWLNFDAWFPSQSTLDEYDQWEKSTKQKKDE
ncbi:uncharacterized protein LODBEIA_P41640 [Lodderomyces beijingensis]|uniref:Dol-P-Man:Man(5)GlcNAc(2)-PP-Dol alpha-1,3-mannosyltransferase n=1 Tax=Lodderomyces beijingensis TaxID=1775926 RepID=A0ABP0ZP55_9ASCO